MAIQQIRTFCAMCVSRCGVVASVEDGRLTRVTADPDHPNGCICVKGTAAPEIVYAPDRLQRPMMRTRPKGDPDPGWTPISWDEALTLVAARLLDIKHTHGPESVAFGYATPSAGAMGDSTGWLERLANAFGTPNIVAPSYICHWHRDFGSHYTYGTGTPLPDYDNARCILLWGFNPQVSWPAVALRINRARSRGAKVIVIDPRRTNPAAQADAWLRVRPGTDHALALAMIHVLLEERLYDEPFVRAWTNGPFLVRDDTGQLLTDRDLTIEGEAETYIVWDEQHGGPARYRADRGYNHDGVVAALSGAFTFTLADGRAVSCRPAFELLRQLAAGYAPEDTEQTTWVAADVVRRAVRMFATERPSCYYSWVGLEQHHDAMQTNRAVSLFFALTGQFDARGSNVIFGAPPVTPVGGHALLPLEQAQQRLGYSERPLGPAGLYGRVRADDFYRAILTDQPYPVKAFVTFGSDLLLGNSDPLRGKAALEALDFYVHIDMVANPTASFADVLLPVSTCWEREGLMPSFRTAEDTAPWIQLRPAVIAPLHEARSDLEIIFDLAGRLGLAEHFFDGNIEAALDHHLAPSGLGAARLRAEPGGMRLDVPTQHQKYAAIDVRTGQPRGFQTPTRKVEVYSTSFAKRGYAPLPREEGVDRSSVRVPNVDEAYPLMLTFNRLVQFCDEQHRNIPRLRKQVPVPFLEIHPVTATNLDIQDGDAVVLETASGAVRLTAKLDAFLDPRVVSTQYGWWQRCQQLDLPAYDPFGPAGANANLLVPSDVADPITGSVPHRSQNCRVQKAGVSTPMAEQ